MTPRPHSEEVERALLGSVMLNPVSLLELGDLVSERSFYLERHRVIWSALECLGPERGGDLIQLADALKAAGALDAVGGLAYLARLDTDLPDLTRARDYAQALEGYRILRDMIGTAEEMARDCQRGEAPAEELLLSYQGRMASLGESSRAVTFEQIGRHVDELERRLDDPAESYRGIHTGYRVLDAMTQGMAPGQLIILAARPGMGKTSFALNAAAHQARTVSVGFVSLEMSEAELVERQLASASLVPLGQIKSGRLDPMARERVARAAREVRALELHLIAPPSMTVSQLAGHLRRLKATEGLDVAYVDYLSLLKDESGASTRNGQIEAITRELKSLARELEIPIVLLCQLNRETERRGGDKRPLLSDLRDSGAIEQDADIVAFVHRPGYYQTEADSVQTDAEIIVAKHRGGPTGIVPVRWEGETTSFRDLERDGAPPIHEHHQEGPPTW